MIRFNVAISTVLLGLISAAAHGQAITYQGQLRESGAPAEGIFDLSFQLFGSDDQFDPVGNAIQMTDVEVVDGVFSVKLDFGPNLQGSSPRWLEIAVEGQILIPRVELTAAPFSLNTRGLTVTPGGAVGVGTDAPQLSLDVATPTAYNAPALGGTNNGHHAYLHIGPDNPSLIWDDGAALRFGSEPMFGDGYLERMRITGDGRVGINTQTPEDSLHVVGAENDGTNATLRLDSPGQTLLMDGDEIDSISLGGLFLNNNVPYNVALAVGGGRVGIGTSSPGRKLDVRNGEFAISNGVGAARILSGANFASDAGYFQTFDRNGGLLAGLGGDDLVGGQIFVRNTTGQNNIFLDGGTGRVGIGTGNPNTVLDIRHSGDFYSPIRYQTSGVSGPALALAHTGAGGKEWLLLSHGSFNGTAGNFSIRNETDFLDALLVTPTGNVEIGSFASPDTHLTARTAGGNQIRAGVKLRHFNDEIGWDIESDERNSGNGLHIIRHLDGEGGITAMYLDRFSGNVGIGTTTPGTKLDVIGEVRMNVATIVGGSDIAEPYDVAARSGTQPAPGMVVSIDPQRIGKMRIADTALDRTVAGIISGANGVNPGITLRQTGTIADGEFPVASIGRVWCWCDADANGAIAAGDLLTTSSTPGHAMKVNRSDDADGAIIGKAMSALESGRGLVLVLVSLK